MTDLLEHLSFGVGDLARSVRFYDAALAALGYARLWTAADAAGYGSPGQTDERFAIKRETDPGALGSSARSHVAFSAPTPEAVAAFHAAALANGGVDQGLPGLRPRYGPGYFAAFVRDPDGYRLEAVCHSGGTPP